MLSDQELFTGSGIHEVQMLANFDLDVEELEQRLELATALHVDCYENGCGGNCTSACGGNCSTACGSNGCFTDGCASHCC